MGVLIIKLTLEEGNYSSPQAELIDLSEGELRDAYVGLGIAHISVTPKCQTISINALIILLSLIYGSLTTA
jgi:hypothetical protein